MLTSFNRMNGQPVVWRDRQIGYVERAVADVRTMCLEGVVVRRGFGSAKWVPRGSVLLAGARCVVLSNAPQRMPKAEQTQVRRAVWTTGSLAGDVSDVILEGDTLRIAALEVAQGPLAWITGKRAYAVECRLFAQDEVIVPKLLSWAQLLTLLGEGEDA